LYGTLLLFLLQPTNSQSISQHYLFLYNIHSYMPNQHTKNMNKGMYMQPQLHTACTRIITLNRFYCIAKQRLEDFLIYQ